MKFAQGCLAKNPTAFSLLTTKSVLESVAHVYNQERGCAVIVVFVVAKSSGMDSRYWWRGGQQKLSSSPTRRCDQEYTEFTLDGGAGQVRFVMICQRHAT